MEASLRGAGPRVLSIVNGAFSRRYFQMASGTKGNTGEFGFGTTKRLGVHTIKMAQFTSEGTVSISEEIDLRNSC